MHELKVLHQTRATSWQILGDVYLQKRKLQLDSSFDMLVNAS